MDHIVIDGISKSFGEFKALDNIDIKIAKGAIHAILGENGAGKTTLMNILYGLYQPDEGRILLDGKELRLASPADAIAHGIGMSERRIAMLTDPHHSRLPAFLVNLWGIAAGFPHAWQSRASVSQSAYIADPFGVRIPLIERCPRRSTSH